MGVPVAVNAASAEKRGLLLAFAGFGAFWGAWVAALPDVREQVGVEDGRLGLALGAIAVAALPAMPLAGRLMDRHGADRLVPASLLLFALAATLPGFATGMPGLVAALLLVGATTGALDVLLNTATAAWERQERKRLMAAGHGCFSAGLLVASVGTGIARDLGAGPRTVLVVTAAAILAIAAGQPAYRRSAETVSATSGRRRIGPVLLVLGVLTGLSFLVEDAVTSWSALHLERTFGAPPWVGGLGPGLFAGAMVAGRFAVHAWAGGMRDAVVVASGAVGLAAGLLLLSLAPAAPISLAGMVLAGAGVSVLAPTLFSAVGARSEPGRQGADLALASAIGYGGFVAGPPLIGFLSAATSLPTALALLTGLPVVIGVAGSLVLRQPMPRAAAGSQA